MVYDTCYIEQQLLEGSFKITEHPISQLTIDRES